MYGRSDDEWEEIRDAAERFLVAIAVDQGTTNYSLLNQAITNETGHRPFDFGQEQERAAIGRLLGEISKKTNAEHGAFCSRYASWFER
jgi:hypothetical protein